MMAKLDNTQAVFPQVKNAVEKEAEKKQAVRRMKDKMRSTAGALVGGRIRRCGHVSTSAMVGIKKSEKGVAHYSGIETCGSVWGCSVCASKVSEKRRLEVEAGLDGHKAAFGSVYMAAFTIPHHAFQKAKFLREGVAVGWRKMCSGRAWCNAQSAFGITGTIRSMEVTHGQNGWHPHLHVLFLVDPMNDIQEAQFSDFLFSRWQSIIEKMGLGLCSIDAWHIEKCKKTKEAGDYVAKWGCDHELTGGQNKIAKGGGRSPWALLQDSAKGDKRAGALFKEYFDAFFGSRQLTWSLGLKKRFGIGDVADETVADQEPPAKIVVTLTPEEWRLIRSGRLRMIVLEAAENGGREAVEKILNNRRQSDGLRRTSESASGVCQGRGQQAYARLERDQKNDDTTSRAYARLCAKIEGIKS